ncbi:ATP-dependent DNA ligase clustered with Ku protein,LigD [Citrifermentans bremense]|uniref:DNA ligase (ATP) n=1 Tax=Citrifermentans bremense TaxID=60035 RepID=A0A6S6LUP4_9BACT|nr:DNA ligase D [Citrifermentans bremense]BCG45363.1 ATP-dependent DNA ligase clustered with Ku protein,LigD [Citrifermentans bremense]
MGLEEYQRKRDLGTTPEPPARAGKSAKSLRFVVHKHSASHLHYDFRLELDGVLKSWAIPKGPSLDPSVKRLAMMVEDHPYDYGDFEGVIPKGNYGAGEVIIWDAGTYAAVGAADPELGERQLREGLRKGDLKFVLSGTKLNGEYALVRIKGDKDNTWLLIKKKDQFSSAVDVTLQDRSVVSNLSIEEVRAGQIPRLAPAAAAEAAEPVGPVGPDPDPMPHRITPMLAGSVAEPFDDPGWLFEIKLDGYRAIAEIENGQVQLYSRNNLSFNKRFPAIVSSLASLPVTAVLDGEVVALDEKGRSYFQLLQNSQRTGEPNIYYFAFDLLYLDGKDLRAEPLLARKERLRSMLPEIPWVRFSDHITEYGKQFFELARENNLEGILAKRADSLYFAGRRSGDWLKIKIRLQQEAVICGFTQPRGSRKGLGSLVLGVYENEELVYIGLAGGGFDEAGLKEMYAALQPLVQPESPFRQQVKTSMPVTWVKPVLVCEVEFAEWTDENVMRQPIFLGLREDKDPRSVVREIFPAEVQSQARHEQSTDLDADAGEPAAEKTAAAETSSKKGGTKKGEESVVIDGQKLTLTNLDKVFWPEEGYTKGDVVDYYRKMAPVILPYLADRPESMYRTPHGITEGGFYQKEAGDLLPPWITAKEIYSKHVDKNIRFLVCQDEATLVYMANLGCIEINPWLSRLQQLDYPDYLVIDLDPEDIPFEKVVETAIAVREVLESAGAESFPKTSGATGIHIYVPLGARYDYETAGGFAKLVATLAHHKVPGFTSLLRSPKERQKKVYLDFLQNKPGQTLAAPYSIRPRPGATVSTPLKWEEVKPGLDPRQFTIRSIGERLERVGDLFQGVLGPGIDIERCLDRLQNG